MELLNGIFRVRDLVSVQGRTGEWMILRLAYGVATLDELESVSFGGGPRFKGKQVGALIENLLLLKERNGLPLLEQRRA